jgi:hypothetical protein
MGGRHWWLIHLFGLPRGVLGTFLSIFSYHLPIVLFKALFKQNKLDILSELLIRILRYTMVDCKVQKHNYMLGLADQLFYRLTSWKGFTLKYVTDLAWNQGDKKVLGLWVADKGFVIPAHQSLGWKDVTVVYWIHGELSFLWL